MLKAPAADAYRDNCTCVPGNAAGASGSLELTSVMGHAWKVGQHFTCKHLMPSPQLQGECTMKILAPFEEILLLIGSARAKSLSVAGVRCAGAVPGGCDGLPGAAHGHKHCKAVGGCAAVRFWIPTGARQMCYAPLHQSQHQVISLHCAARVPGPRDVAVIPHPHREGTVIDDECLYHFSVSSYHFPLRSTVSGPRERGAMALAIPHPN